MPFVKVLNKDDITQIAGKISTLYKPAQDNIQDELNIELGGVEEQQSQFAQQLAQVSQTILETKVNIGRSAYPTGLNLLKSPRFWLNFFALGTTGASMVAFNSSVSQVTKDGDVILTGWIPYEYKKWLFLLSATMATNLPLNLKQAVEISFAEFERLYGDLHLWGPFKFKEFKDAIKNMQFVTKNEFPNMKRYVAAVTWALGSAGAFAGMGLMGGMSDLLTIPVILAFGFLHMSVMTELFLPKPESLLKNLTQGERVAQLLQKAYVTRLQEAVKHLPEGFFDSSVSTNVATLNTLMKDIQSKDSIPEYRNSAAIKFELHLLNFLQNNKHTANIEHPSTLKNVADYLRTPRNHTRVFAATLAGYLFATMVFFIWLLQKIHKTTDENTIRAYNDTGYVLGALSFVPFIGFVLQVLPGQASNLYQLIRHPQQSWRERSLAAQQGLWMVILLLVQFVFYLLVIPSTGSLNYLNNQFLNALFPQTGGSSDANDNISTAYIALWWFLQLTAYPMTFIFNSLGIGPATANIANTAIAIPGGRAGTMQTQQRVLEYAQRLAKFEDQQTPAAFLAHLHDVKQKLTENEFEQFCQAKFNLEDVKTYVASIDKPTSDQEGLLRGLSPAIKNAETYSELIGACFADMQREARERDEVVNAAANVGLFGGRNYTGMARREHVEDTPSCLQPLQMCCSMLGWCQK